MRVTVFGGSSPRPGEPAYQDAYQLGYALGKAGHKVLTGGYIGTMEAVSWGAAEAGGHVIGVTCEEIENWRATKPNQYVMELMRFQTLSDRLMALVLNCDAAIALPGGIGTLAEIAMFWNHMAIQVIPLRPLVLVGKTWKTTLETFLGQFHGYIADKDQHLLRYADTINDALEQIQIPA